VVGRVLAASVALHLAVGVALARLRTPSLRGARAPIELTVIAPRAHEPPRQTPTPSPEARAESRPRHASQASSEPRSTAPTVATPTATPPQFESSPPPRPSKPPNLFAASALASAADIQLAPTAADRAWRPRHGVGGDGAAGGVDVGSFLAEDAARLRVEKGTVAPGLRTAERRLDTIFSPTFGQSDISNRAELLLKQFRGFLRDPPKTGELQRGLDPTQETLEEKMRSRQLDRAFFLGRRVEIFVRQRADGSIVDMALRNPSGYRAFDDAALAAVEKALGGVAPGRARDGEVRTLWQLDATAYVVISPNPEIVFDESTGKREWRYPLQKRVDHHVRLVAVY
jgi:outer membrane biosynthesis protein TonB